MKLKKLLLQATCFIGIGSFGFGLSFFIVQESSFAQTCNPFGCSKPGAGECNPFGCPNPGAGECNPFGCPNPGASACTPFGCPESPANSNPNPNIPNNQSSNFTSDVRQLCNKSGENVNVAIAYQSGVSKGWWTLNNDNCLKLYNHPVHGVATHYYANTVRANNRARWFGDRSASFCISSPKAFEIGSMSGCTNGFELRPFGSVNSGVTLTR